MRSRGKHGGRVNDGERRRPRRSPLQNKGEGEERAGSGGEGASGRVGREPEASGCPYPPRGACSGVAGEVVRRRRARAVARTVGKGEGDRGEWAGLAWASWLRWRGGPRPRGRPGALALSLFIYLLSLFLFFFLLFCFSHFRPPRHFAKMLDHHQYYQENILHMMNILVFMFEHF